MRKGAFIRTTGVVVGLLALYAVGLGLRRSVVEAQETAYRAGPLPFTLESALQFRRVRTILEEGRLPDHDPAVQFPEGVDVRKTYTVGSEYLYAILSQCMPSSLSLESRLRWIEASIYCVGIIMVALWIGWWGRSIMGGAVAGFIYAVSPASIMRSTGLELSRENVALPLLAAHLACSALVERAGTRKRRLLIQMGSAALLGLALVSWDLVQYYVVLWMLASCARHLRVRHAAGESFLGWGIHFAVLSGAGLVNPYLRSHGFPVSPAMLLGYGLVLVKSMDHLLGARHDQESASRISLWPKVVLFCLPLLVGWLCLDRYGAGYGHFVDLVAAKIRFLNAKPADPSLLSFDQRIMWVPALHSASWPLARALFPASLLLTILAALVLLYRPESLKSPGLYQLVFFYAASLVAFYLFVRFHVFLALFSAGLIGLWTSWALRSRGWRRNTLVVLLLVGCLVEAEPAVRKARSWGRTGVYYKELAGLTAWFSGLEKPAPVLGNFGVSSSILAYGNCPIILHPKFEGAAIRNRVQEYGTALFLQPEEAFRSWALRHGARYYVYAIGEFATRSPERQMRYFVDALVPPDDAAARLFEYRPEEGRYFFPVWANRKYRVFKILSEEEEAHAIAYTAEAQGAFEQGNLDRAEALAAAALDEDPLQEGALSILGHVAELRKQGFSTLEPDDE